MASDKEKIELFCEENIFDPGLTPKYIKFVSEEFDSFKLYSDVVYEMDRRSDAFKTLTKYHSQAMKNKEYQKMYMEAVEEAHEEFNKKE